MSAGTTARNRPRRRPDTRPAAKPRVLRSTRRQPVLAALNRTIAREVRKLGPREKYRVLSFAQALSTPGLSGTPGKELLQFAGSISSDDCAVIQKAIEDGCEGVDANEW